jgi:hypothetical protein
VAAGIWLHRPASRAPWLPVGAGQFLFFSGDGETDFYPRLLGGEAPLPVRLAMEDFGTGR